MVDEDNFGGYVIMNANELFPVPIVVLILPLGSKQTYHHESEDMLVSHLYVEQFGGEYISRVSDPKEYLINEMSFTNLRQYFEPVENKYNGTSQWCRSKICWRDLAIKWLKWVVPVVILNSGAWVLCGS